MRIFSFSQPLNFMRLKWPAIILSTLLILGSFFSIATKGINWGLDFTGGTVLEVGFTQDADLTQVRNVLAERGYADAVVQYFGSSQDISIRIAPRDGVEQSRISNEILTALAQTTADGVEMRRIEFVGPSVGGELRAQAATLQSQAFVGQPLLVGGSFCRGAHGGGHGVSGHDGDADLVRPHDAVGWLAVATRGLQCVGQPADL